MNAEKDPMKAVYMSSTISEDDEILIERLVDGELSEEERRDLILRLDETVDGWRFCALSFLEDQAFESALRSLPYKTAVTAENAQPPLARNLRASRRDSVNKLLRVVAVSALCVVIAAVSLSVGRYIVPSRAFVDSTTIADARQIKIAAPSDIIPAGASSRIPEITENVISSHDAMGFPDVDSQAKTIAWEDAPTVESVNGASAITENMGVSMGGMGAMYGMSGSAPRARAMRAPHENDAFKSVKSAREANASLALGTFIPASLDISDSSSNTLSLGDYGLQERAFDDRVPDPNNARYLLANEAERGLDYANFAQSETDVESQNERQTDGEIRSSKSGDGVALLNCPAAGFSDVPVSYSESAQYKPSEITASNNALPQEVLQRLNTVGGRVESQRNEYRFPLNDGRTLIVPVDDYTVRYDENMPIW